MRRRLVWAGLLILMAVGYLAYTSWQGATLYYLTPSEVVSQAATLAGRSFRLAGNVVDGSVVWDSPASELRFVVTDGTSAVTVTYRGAPPDNLVAGQQIVAEGLGDDRGGMIASRLIVKCPSKYEEGTVTASGNGTGSRGLLLGAGALVVAVTVVALAGRLVVRANRAGRREGRG